MIIVTGGAGFIGSNLIKALNNQGYHDILVVDDLEDGTKYTNLVDLSIIDYLDKQTFIQKIEKNEEFGEIEGVFHEGACSATTEWNGKFMMENNYEYSKKLLHYCLNRSIPFLYASSAAVYGAKSSHFIENQLDEKPLNVYGYSKYLFDCHVMRLLPKITSPVCGFRYFNVYGPREQHKGSMSSVAFHLNTQLQQGNTIKLFEGSEQFKRDFIYVNDAVAMNIWFWLQRKSGIFNCGTGKAESFKSVADAVLQFHQRGELEYIPFPEHLKGRYQRFTQADMSLVRAAGYQQPFHSVTEGTLDYMQHINP